MSDDAEGDAKASANAEPVQVYIFNQTYNLRSPSDEEYVRRVARVVDERMRQLAALAPNQGAEKIAVLVALHLADELERAREENGDDDGGGAAASSSSTNERRSEEVTDETAERAGAPDTWFDNFFETEFKGERGEGSLSARVAERLHTRRQERRSPITIEPDEKK